MGKKKRKTLKDKKIAELRRKLAAQEKKQKAKTLNLEKFSPSETSSKKTSSKKTSELEITISKSQLKSDLLKSLGLSIIAFTFELVIYLSKRAGLKFP